MSTIETKTCLFCPNPLDGSDEHILAKSINGRLHSEDLICSKCNSQRFGVQIDSVLSETFKQIIHVIGLKNARSLYVEDPQGRKYVKNTKHQVKPIKPKLTTFRKDGLTHFSISGDKKNVLKLLEKHSKEFLKGGSKLLKLDVIRNVNGNPPMGMQLEFPINSKMILVLNKMSLEFFALKGGDRRIVENLTVRVANLDTSLDNVVFCNFNQEIRKFDDEEISHALVLGAIQTTGVLYCYIELFNLACAIVILSKEYRGPEINIQHRQDVLNGKLIDKPLELTIDTSKLIPNGTLVDKKDFSILLDLFFERHQDRNFKDVLDENLNEIKANLEKEIAEGLVQKEEFENTFLHRGAELIAYLTIYDFPFSVSDIDEDQQRMINYIHSCLPEDQFEEFCNLNKKLLGVRVAFTSDQHSPEKCVIESFIKTPIAKPNGRQIVKVYCVLRHVDDEELKYIPFRDLFEGLRRIQEEGIKYVTE